MHVVHLNLERGWRGGERQVWLLARELSRAGVRQTVVCRRGEALAKRLAGLPELNRVEVRGRLEAAVRLSALGTGLIVHAHTGNTVPLALLPRLDRKSVV